MDVRGMHVLSVDDNTNNLLMIEAFAHRMGLEIESFDNPIEAIMVAENKLFDIVILDYMMPVMDGHQFIKAFRQIDMITPIVMVTALGDDNDVQLKALEQGANDFMSKPINYPVFAGRITNLLKLKKAHMLLEQKADDLESDVRKATAEIQEREFETLKILGKTAEYKDPETGEHVSRVAGYSRAIAKGYGLSNHMQEVLFYAAPFHDIGKVGIADAILLKPGTLNDEEWLAMKEHALIGYEILKNSKSEYLKAGGIIAFTHHEKFDGTGYPKGLKGEAIPLIGRIVAVADVFDAITTKRPYKEAWSFEKGLRYIRDERGTHFDPAVVDAFFESMDIIEEIYRNRAEDESY